MPMRSTSHKEIIQMSSDQMKNLGIKLNKAEAGQLDVKISTRGKVVLHPDKLAHILPKVSGLAKNAYANIGDNVQEGQVLAVLESREMADIKASYLAAREKRKTVLLALDARKASS